MKMIGDPWFPIGLELPTGAKAGSIHYTGRDWQVIGTDQGSRVLVSRPSLAARWVADNLIDETAFSIATFGAETFLCLFSPRESALAPTGDCRSPNTQADAQAFAQSLGLTRAIVPSARLGDGIFVETHSRILPDYSAENNDPDELVLGKWLTGGLPIDAGDTVALARVVTWLDRRAIREIVAAASIPLREEVGPTNQSRVAAQARDEHAVRGADLPLDHSGRFLLPGRADLETFFNDHVIDIVQNSDRYRALGIDTPPAIILNGPPGCGKTFAVERLVEFLGWPSFDVDASSIASPYIHDTSRKISETFDAAIGATPSVIVIDEMEAFVGDRSGEGGSHSHRLEELAEFLRRIPQATKAGVLVVGMTNRLDLIDPAILRRGRFDHVIEVGFASATEIQSMLEHLAGKLPKSLDVDLGHLARALEGRPLSDVSFVLREGARLAARAGRPQLSQADLFAALESASPRGQSENRRIGF